MANPKIFCNIPWFELNINHDGSFDLCGCQNDKIVGTDLGQKYNIKQIPIMDYWNGDRLRSARLHKLGDVPDPMCRMCQQKDSTGYISNRVKENLKSVIFDQSFDRSYQQSPHRDYFQYSQDNLGRTMTNIRSLHVNLGNTCNFACRMCSPIASTRLQTEMKQLGWINKDQDYQHWTDDPQAWKNFLDFLDHSGEDIHVIHIIGGEIGYMSKFGFLIDYFVDRGLSANVNISFTTNGSVDYSQHYDKLGRYKRCEIGISIESIDAIGDYIRQGGDIKQILENIRATQENCPDNTALTIRTVPSLLSLPTYANLIRWAQDIGIPIDNSMLVSPAWQQAILLPQDIKDKIIDDISGILRSLPDVQHRFNNQKDPNQIDVSIRNECDGIINLTRLPAPENSEELRYLCASKLDRWDQMKNINIRDYSKDLYDFLNRYGYHGA